MLPSPIGFQLMVMFYIVFDSENTPCVQTVITDSDPAFNINLSKVKISDSERAKLKVLIEKYHDVFSKNAYDLGSSKTDPVHIYTTTEVPVRGRAYRVPVKCQAELEKHINSLIQSERIVESNTPWTSPIVLVKKKNGSLRVCLDFRKLNEVTIPDNYPLPRIDAIIEKVGGSRYFSVLDMANGYLQLRLDAESSYKCGFITENKVYAYTHLPFGLKSAASYFQRALRQVLDGLEDVMVYIDDVLIYSKTFEDHIRTLEMVLERFRKFNLKASPNKCEFFKESIVFLGHEISRDNYSPNRVNVETIRSMPTPTNVNEVRRFVGMSGFFRKFIPNFSERAEPLTRLTKKNQKFVWAEEQQNAVDELSEALTNKPILTFPDYDKPFHIFTDASAVAQGAALMQTVGEDEKDFAAIAFISRTLADTETRWPAVHTELGAIIFALRQFRPYVCMSKIILHSDHKPLRYILAKSKINDQIGRWLVELQQYDISIVHIDGKKNMVAGCLSRAKDEIAPLSGIEMEDIIDFPVCMPIRKKKRASVVFVLQANKNLRLDLVEEQDKDPILRAIKKFLVEPKASIDCVPKSWCDVLEHVEISEKGALSVAYHNSFPKTVIPEHLRRFMFEAFHSSKLQGGHHNWKKTFRKASVRYFWPDMKSDILRWCMECIPCQQRSKPHPSTREPQQIVVTSKLFEKVGVDLCGPLRSTAGGHKYYMNLICWFSKFVVSVPLTDASTDTVVRAILTEVVLKFGTPSELVSDRASTFTSEAFRQFCKLVSIQQHLAIPYHSKGNGATERTFRTFHNMTSKYVNAAHSDWDILLPYLTFSYNTVVHSTTGETPFFLVFGRDPVFAVDRILDPSPPKEAGKSDVKIWKEHLVEILREAWKNTAEIALKAQLAYQKQANQGAKGSEIRPGDRVMFKNFKSKINLSRKLVKPWIGDYRVLEVNHPKALILDLDHPGKEPREVHLDQIKKFYLSENDNDEEDAAVDEEQVPTDVISQPIAEVTQAVEESSKKAEKHEVEAEKKDKPVEVAKNRRNPPRAKKIPVRFAEK